MENKLRQAGAELCKAQYELGLAMQEVSLFVTKYPARQMSNGKLAHIKMSSMLDMPTEALY